MRGLGTIINALAIVIGGVLGILFKRFLKERYQDTIIKATGFSVVFLGAAGTLSKILTVRPDGTLSTGGSNDDHCTDHGKDDRLFRREYP